MRTIKYKTLEDIPGHAAGEIFEATLIFEGNMGDGLMLHPGGGGIGCIETVSIGAPGANGEEIWVHDDQGFINFDATTDQFQTFLTALQIIS